MPLSCRFIFVWICKYYHGTPVYVAVWPHVALWPLFRPTVNQLVTIHYGKTHSISIYSRATTLFPGISLLPCGCECDVAFKCDCWLLGMPLAETTYLLDHIVNFAVTADHLKGEEICQNWLTLYILRLKEEVPIGTFLSCGLLW